MTGLRSVALAIALSGWANLCLAHKPSDSYLTISLPEQGATLQGQWDIALRDLEHAIGLDTDGDGLITWGEVLDRQDAIARYAFSRLAVGTVARGDRKSCPLSLAQLLVDEHVDGRYAVLRFSAACPFRPAQLALHYSLLFDVDPTHRGLANVRFGGRAQAAVLAPDSATLTVSLDTTSPSQQFREFLNEGIWHIWKGYDHILFLLTLLFPAVLTHGKQGWEPRALIGDAVIDVLKVVTAFTIAHSLTLSLAVNGVIQLPSRWIEAAIAATVLLGALNNLRPLVQGRRWLVAFLFGLIHGLGFASALSDLGLKGWNLVLALVGFNSGVEVGQMAIVLLFVPVAFSVRRSWLYRRAFMPAAGVTIAAVAAYWIAIRALGVSFA
jgi:HupE / UreJ protein